MMAHILQDPGVSGKQAVWTLGGIGGESAGSERKESACNAGDWGSIPGSRRFPEEGNGNPL